VKPRQISDDGSYVTIADCMAVQPEWLVMIEQTLARLNRLSTRFVKI